MRNKALIVNRQLIVLAIALPMFAFTAGCKSTTETPTVQAGGNSGAQTEDMSDASIAARVKTALSADPELQPLPGERGDVPRRGAIVRLREFAVAGGSGGGHRA